MEEYKVIEEDYWVGTGDQRIYRFPNGYGASVIRFTMHVPGLGNVPGSSGADAGLWELCLLKFHGSDNLDFSVVYEEGFNDAIGHLTVEGVQFILAQIKSIEVSHE